MYILDNIKLATRSFRTRKLRTALTILGISIGIAAILFLVSLGYGLQHVLLDKIAKLDTLLSLDVSTSNASIIKLDQNIIDEIAGFPNVVEVSPLKSIKVYCKNEKYSSQTNLNAVSKAYFRLGGIELLKGEKFEEDDDLKVILSQGALASLGLDKDNAIGEKVELTLIAPDSIEEKEGEGQIENISSVSLEEKFEIVGILEDDASSYGFIPYKWASKIDFDSYDGLKVRVEKQENLEEVRELIVEKGLSVLALSDTIDQANKIFKVIQIILALFGVVALTVSAIGMFNTMTIALLERTNEIGIMKSIGASNRDIRILFLAESILIGFLGGLGGIIIGIGGTEVVNLGFNILADKLGGQAIDVFQTPIWFVLFILVFSTLIGFFTGIYPSERAAKMNPLMALRYK